MYSYFFKYIVSSIHSEYFSFLLLGYPQLPSIHHGMHFYAEHGLQPCIGVHVKPGQHP
jgi:hypothetical protein